MDVVRTEVEDEIRVTEREIARLRIARDRTSYKLEQVLRERERLYRHLSALGADESQTERTS